MPSPAVSFEDAARLVEAAQATAKDDEIAALMLLAMALRWRASLPVGTEHPADVAESFALAFPHLRYLLRRLAFQIRFLNGEA